MKPARIISLALTFACGSLAAATDDPFAYLDELPVVVCQPMRDGIWSLADVVDAALCRNPQTREVWANARYQAALAGSAQAAYLPKLTGGLGAYRTHSPSAGSAHEQSASLSLSWLVFDFGARAAELESARQLLAAASQTRSAVTQSIFQSAVQSYFQVQASEAAVQAALEAEKAAQESYKAAEMRVQVGNATPADRLQAKTALSQAELARIQAEGAQRSAQGALAAIVGTDAQKTLTILPARDDAPPPAKIAADIEALVAQARSLRPDLAAAEARFKSAASDVAAAQAAGLPSLTFGVTGERSRNDGSTWGNASTLGLTLTVPLFTGFNDTYRVRAAEAQRESRAAQLERLRLQVALDVWNAYHALRTATQSLRASADLLASAEQSAKVVFGRYRAGVGNMLDVLNAQSALAAARQQRILTLYQWNVSRTGLAQAVGNLDANLLQRLTNPVGTESTAP